MYWSKLISYFLLGAWLIFSACAGTRDQQETEIQAVLASSVGYYIQKGAEALNEGRYLEALHLFSEARTLTPYDPVVQNNIGVTFYHLGRLDSAVHAYQTAIRLRPDYIQAYINLSKAYIMLDQYDLAHAAAAQILLYQPQEAQAFALQAEIYEKEGDLEAAIDANRRALNLNPDMIDLRANLGTLLFRNGQIDFAIQQYQQVLQQDSTYGVAYFNLGNALAHKCLLEEAIKQYQFALTYQPTLIPARNNHGLILLFLNQPQQAVRVFRQALEQDQNATMVMYNLSIALAEMDSLHQSLSCIQRAIDLDPATAYFYLQLGRVLDQMGQKEPAIAAFNQALALDSTLATGYNSLANVLSEDELEQAQIAYQRALALYPDYLEKRYLQIDLYFQGGFIDLLANCRSAAQISTDYAMIHNNLGKVYFRTNQYGPALRSFTSAIRIQPNLWEPYENMAVIYFAENKNAMGREMLSRAKVNRAKAAVAMDSLSAAESFCLEALRLYADNPGAYALLADIYGRTNRRKDAETALRRGLSVGKDDFRIHFAYGKFLAWDERYGDAEKYLRRAIQINPRSQEARRKLADVYLATGREDDAYVQLAGSHAALAKEYESAGFVDHALQEYQIAAGLTPENSDYLAAQALIYIKRHQHSEADSLLRVALAKQPDHTRALYAMGLLSGDRKLYSQAVDYLQKASLQTPDDGSIHYALSVNYYFLNRLDKAREHAAKAKALGAQLKETFIEALSQESIPPEDKE
ncbi:tetratricopeptide repeat protein [candidate division KSB1 bacterium]|nr:tetratricopeptide repeat protein [candidate division KSB1 bacterium]